MKKHLIVACLIFSAFQLVFAQKRFVAASFELQAVGNVVGNKQALFGDFRAGSRSGEFVVTSGWKVSPKWWAGGQLNFFRISRGDLNSFSENGYRERTLETSVFARKDWRMAKKWTLYGMAQMGAGFGKSYSRRGTSALITGVSTLVELKADKFAISASISAGFDWFFNEKWAITSSWGKLEMEWSQRKSARWVNNLPLDTRSISVNFWNNFQSFSLGLRHFF